MKMIKWIKSLQFAKVMFAILTVVTMGLFAWGAHVPPPGIIDSSLLYAGAILFGFALLWVVAHIVIEIGKEAKAKVSKDGIELEIVEDNK